MAEEQPVDYEQILKDTIEEIWSQYDKNGDGHLDRSEMRAFVEKTFQEAGMEMKQGNISDEEFNKIFNKVDSDESGTIEKDEMALLIKQLAGV